MTRVVTLHPVKNAGRLDGGFGMGHRVRAQRSDVRSQTAEDRRQKRAELVEEWSIM